MLARYGLPAEVQFCKRCVISNQRPSSTVETTHTIDSRKQTIFFDADGVCDACRVVEAKKSIDWKERENELLALLDQHRSNGEYPDCIVPGSGGKDSFYQAHILKYKYGMTPLTVTWAPHLYTEWGWRNFQRWIAAGFDNLLVTPNSKVHRVLTRVSLENLFHPFQPFIVGQKLIAAKLSVLNRIPLVFYGENEAEYGNPRATNQVAKRDLVYHSQETLYLGGVSIDKLKSRYGLTTADLTMYQSGDSDYPQIHYLGYYLRWHPQAAYYYAVQNGDFEPAPERTPGTYSKYNSIDDKMDDLHYYTTFIKFGIGRATYDASQEVRSGDITRDEAVALVRRFDGEFPSRFTPELFEYLSPEGFSPMNSETFKALAEAFKSPHLWDGDHLRHHV